MGFVWLKCEMSVKWMLCVVSGYGWCRVYLRCYFKISLLEVSWVSGLKFWKIYFVMYKLGNS